MEDVVTFDGFWRGRRVLVTGHTGFKGSWLSLWLQRLGATVTGYALAPASDPALFTLARVADGMCSVIGDVRDRDRLAVTIAEAAPEVVFHLAAQPLVLAGYHDPVGTYATNVMGTVHLFDALRRATTVRAVVNVTTDKVYAAAEPAAAHREGDPLGGDDPYSGSKACAELVTSTMRAAYFPSTEYREHGVAIATARAGNVIGGGDWARDRLVPDLLAAQDAGRAAIIRRPEAVRPWQHVLDPLAGYLLLAERLYTDGVAFGDAWNFGPACEDAKPVWWIADRLAAHRGAPSAWRAEPTASAYTETALLTLDARRAADRLGWRPVLSVADAVAWTAEWHEAWRAGADMQRVTCAQIDAFLDRHPARTDDGARVAPAAAARPVAATSLPSTTRPTHDVDDR